MPGDAIIVLSLFPATAPTTAPVGPAKAPPIIAPLTAPDFSFLNVGEIKEL